MGHSKLPWEYVKDTYEEKYYDSYKGYTHEFNSPRQYTRHEIIRRGKTGNVLEVIFSTSVFTGTSQDKKIEENYRLIVKAVNSRSDIGWMIYNEQDRGKAY